MSTKQAIIRAAAVAALIPQASADVGYDSARCYHAKGKFNQAGRESMEFTVGAKRVPELVHIVCSNPGRKNAFESVFLSSPTSNVLEEYDVGFPDAEEEWLFNPAPPAGTGLDPLRKVDASHYATELADLRSTVGKLNRRVLRGARISAKTLRTKGEGWEDVADKSEAVCAAALQGLISKYQTFDRLCDEVQASSKDAVKTALDLGWTKEKDSFGYLTLHAK